MTAPNIENLETTRLPHIYGDTYGVVDHEPRTDGIDTPTSIIGFTHNAHFGPIGNEKVNIQIGSVALDPTVVPEFEPLTDLLPIITREKTQPAEEHFDLGLPKRPRSTPAGKMSSDSAHKWNVWLAERAGQVSEEGLTRLESTAEAQRVLRGKYAGLHQQGFTASELGIYYGVPADVVELDAVLNAVTASEQLLATDQFEPVRMKRSPYYQPNRRLAASLRVDEPLVTGDQIKLMTDAFNEEEKTLTAIGTDPDVMLKQAQYRDSAMRYLKQREIKQVHHV